MLPEPRAHVMCLLQCDMCQGGDIHAFEVKFGNAYGIWACAACVARHGEKALWEHVRNYDWQYLCAVQCIRGVDFDGVRVQRSSGALDSAWHVSPRADRTLVFEGAEIRVCVEKNGYMKFTPLRSLCGNNSWQRSTLCWDSEPHLSAAWRARWEFLWRDALFWRERCIALLYTFGDDVGRLISEY